MTPSGAGRAALFGALLAASSARGETATGACLNASEEAQTLRDQGKLLDARAKLIACGRGDCPAVVRSECARWLDELVPRIPAVIIRARDAAGNDLVDVRIVVDGTLRGQSLDGRALDVDPGVHKFRFERAGSEPIEQTVVARERERDRILDVTFTNVSAVPPASVVKQNVATPPVPPVQTHTTRPIPALSVALAGVAVASGATFAFLASIAKSDVTEMRDSCAPSCASDDVSRARTELTAANVSLAVGIVALGAAAAVFFTRPTKVTNTVGVVRF